MISKTANAHCILFVFEVPRSVYINYIAQWVCVANMCIGNSKRIVDNRMYRFNVTNSRPELTLM